MILSIEPARLAPLLCALAMLAAGCGKQPPASAPVAIPTDAREQESTTPPALSLNDGKKWDTDDHTRRSIQRMRDLIEATPPETLGRALAGEMHDLLAGCKLEGEAHNQLHFFLGELQPHANGLYATEDPAERAAEIEAMKRLFTLYDQYFE